MVVSFITEQGGVGKTSLCFNLGWYLSSIGKKVLMIDLDPQGGNLSFMAGVKDLENKKGIQHIMSSEEGEYSIKNTQYQLKPNLYIIPANEDAIELTSTIKGKDKRARCLDRIIQPVKDKFDYIFIDMNPTPSEIHLVSLIASDGVIIPLLPDGKSIEGTTHVVDTFESVRDNFNPDLKILGVVYNKYEKRTNLSKAVESAIAKFCNEKDIYIADTKIPINTAIGETFLTKTGITDDAPKSKGAICYKALASELFL